MVATVCLVNTPGSDIERPSIALGTLKSILARAGISASVIYANISFADRVGMKYARWISRSPVEYALGDWIFSRKAFPSFRSDDQGYISEIFTRAPYIEKLVSAHRLIEIRDDMPEFVDELVERILAQSPKIVGCTSSFNQHVGALAILRRVKEVAPDVITMLGGANCESIMGRATHQHFPWVDFVVSGEADELIAPLCEAALYYGVDIPAHRLPEGVFSPSHRRDGYPTCTYGDGTPRAVVKDMSSVPQPDYDEYFQALATFKYREGVLPGLLIETSRGCWWGAVSHCTFCGLNGGAMNFRSKSADVVLDEIKALTEDYQIKKIAAVDNILDMTYFKDVIPALANDPEKYEIFYEIKSNIKKWQVELLSQAGIKWVQPGIESFDSRVLKLMHKGVHAWQNVALLKWCRQYGIRTFWNLLCGTPGEEDVWYQEMADFLPALHHFLPGQPAHLQYVRFSPYHSNAEKFGLKLLPAPLYTYVYPLSSVQLNDLVYFFEEETLPEGGAESRPGMAACVTALQDWCAAWNKSAKPTCCLVRRSSGAFILDTRSCATSVWSEIGPVGQAILEISEEGCLHNAIVSQVCERTAAPLEDVRSELERLIQARLILVLDERVLSLVLTDPILPTGRLSDYPGGYSFIHYEDRAEDALVGVNVESKMSEVLDYA